MSSEEQQALGLAFVLSAVVIAAVIAVWPRRSPDEDVILEAEEMSETREQLQEACPRIADDEGLPDSALPVLLDYADTLVERVEAGTVTLSSALAKVTAQARRLRRLLDDAQASPVIVRVES